MEENDTKNKQITEADSSEESKNYVETESGSCSLPTPGKYSASSSLNLQKIQCTLYD